MRDLRLGMAILCTALFLPAVGCGEGVEARKETEGEGARRGSEPRAADARSSSAPDRPGGQGSTHGALPEGAPSGLISGHDPDPAVSGGGALPESHPPGGGPGTIEPPPAGSGAGASGMVWIAPTGWKEEAPSTRMRRSQFRVPRASGDAEDGECAVFYFGPGQGGTPESNASRWVDQFQQPDGSPSAGKAKVSMRTVSGNDVMFVEVRGTYAAMVMPGMAGGAPKDGYALLGAIVPGPDAPWFFKFTGPVRTVEANRAAFEALISSIRQGARS